MALQDAQENVQCVYETGGRKRSRVLVDMRGVRSQTREARHHFAASTAAQRATLCVALLIGSPVSRVLANFYLRLGPQIIPTQLFTSERAAIDWLMSHAP